MPGGRQLSKPEPDQEIKPGQKYNILEFPGMTTDIHTVKVTKLWSHPTGDIVEYRYQPWPLYITRQVPLKEFKSWLVTQK